MYIQIGRPGDIWVTWLSIEHFAGEEQILLARESQKSPKFPRGVSGWRLKPLQRELSRSLRFATLRTVTCQAPQSMGFPRQEYWNGLPFPPPGDLSDPGTKPASPALAGRVFTTAPPGKPPGDRF